MTKQETLHQSRQVCRVRRLSIHTEESYIGWIRQFCDHVKRCGDIQREEKVRLFLEELAPRTAAATQNQALNAIVFLFRDVLQTPLGEI